MFIFSFVEIFHTIYFKYGFSNFYLFKLLPTSSFWIHSLLSFLRKNRFVRNNNKTKESPCCPGCWVQGRLIHCCAKLIQLIWVSWFIWKMMLELHLGPAITKGIHPAYTQMILHQVTETLVKLFSLLLYS